MTKKQSFAQRMRTAMDIRNIKQVELVERTGLTKSAINQYYSGKYEPKQKGTYLIAQALDVSESWLMGYDVPMERLNVKYPDNVYKIEPAQYPTLDGDSVTTGRAANTSSSADFCVQMPDESMINARINAGDIIFIDEHAAISNGSIVAVLIENQVTIRRIYYVNNEILLLADNPTFPQILATSDVRVLGRAVMFQSNIM